MLEIKEISIEQVSKNILVTYFDTELKAHARKGFNPLIERDWEDIELDANLKPYKDLAWAGLTKPQSIEAELNVDEHE